MATPPAQIWNSIQDATSPEAHLRQLPHPGPWADSLCSISFLPTSLSSPTFHRDHASSFEWEWGRNQKTVMVQSRKGFVFVLICLPLLPGQSQRTQNQSCFTFSIPQVCSTRRLRDPFQTQARLYDTSPLSKPSSALSSHQIQNPCPLLAPFQPLSHSRWPFSCSAHCLPPGASAPGCSPDQEC